MSNCNWIVEDDTGDHVLMSNGKECARIPEGNNIKTDEGKPGASTITLEEIKEQLEKECNC